ncbi:hypothetical protein H0H87_010785 [Tephrocybe sp. NHM501043]|nr:hypothetical protein H0H87_010785 [Tephrocybe sp. NHM501043]
MNSALRRILVIGGNGFIGSAICKAALAKGIQVTSISSSGLPYRSAKGHAPAWVNKVDWQRGDALHPESFAHLLPEVDGVIHTLGTLLENSNYKQAIKRGDILGLVGILHNNVVGDHGNPLENSTDESRRGSYDVMNRDTALRVCEAFVSSPMESRAPNAPRPFVYISAEDIFRPLIPGRYIESKREAERGIDSLMDGRPDYRGVYIRPTTLHAKMPPTMPTPSSILRSIGATLAHGSNTTSSLDSIANALTVPPIHVDHVAAAVCAVLDSASPVRGAVGVQRMRELLGWVAPSEETEVGLGRVDRQTLQKQFCRSIGYSVPSRRALPFFLNAKAANDDYEHDQSRFLRMLMFGKPGAGKGTLSARLVNKYDILSLSTGDLLRQHIAERTEVGREAEETVARGGLIPDEIMLKVVTSKLDSLHNKVRTFRPGQTSFPK